MVSRHTVGSHMQELDSDADARVRKQSDLHGENVGCRCPVVFDYRLRKQRVEQSDVVWLVGGNLFEFKGGRLSGGGEGSREEMIGEGEDVEGLDLKGIKINRLQNAIWQTWGTIFRRQTT
ncbi:hypothetical protein LINPERPRIM_LOCUS15456 [Linum perenne]